MIQRGEIMKKTYLLFIVFTITIFIGCTIPEKDNSITDYVDPFIGTGGHGHTFPGAAYPFGMVQLSPDNYCRGWDWTSGYHYSDSILLGFSHTHFSGTGVGDLLDILITPYNSVYPDNAENEYEHAYFTYDHEDEVFAPGYYGITLDEGNIKAELTVSERVGFHKYTFKDKGYPQVLIDLGYAQNWDSTTASYIKHINDTTFIGYRESTGWAQYQKVWFAIRTSAPFRCQYFDSTKAIKKRSMDARYSVVSFNVPDSIFEVKLKVAISTAGYEGALKNLEEIDHWDFEKVREETRKKWENELSKITVSIKNEADTRTFYTALYHSYIAPHLYEDANQQFLGYDKEIKTAIKYDRYTLFSLWDTFRSLHPLLTITQPELVNNVIKSFIAFYDEKGVLPSWEFYANETDCMIGYHAVPVISDAYMKKVTDVSAEELLEAMVTTAMQDTFGIDHYRKFGYIPSELERESVSKTLEYAFDDWCIAQLAAYIGKEEIAEEFLKRSESYKNLFDTTLCFMRGKDANGDWVEPFDPKFVDHRRSDFTEANAWQYTWHVLHDVPGLIELFGSEERFIEKLDSLFIIDSELTGENISLDISGLIGQYAHGNEPGHHIPYLYNFTSKPWKTQELVHKIMRTMYNDTPAGLCGNEDCGQMSSWYVLSAIGFYPLNPADGKYWFGSPLFDEVKIDVGNKKTFVIKTVRKNDDDIFIKNVELNGKILDRYYVTYEEIMNGGNLIFTMSPTHP